MTILSNALAVALLMQPIACPPQKTYCNPLPRVFAHDAMAAIISAELSAPRERGLLCRADSGRSPTGRGDPKRTEVPCPGGRLMSSVHTRLSKLERRIVPQSPPVRYELLPETKELWAELRPIIEESPVMREILEDATTYGVTRERRRHFWVMVGQLLLPRPALKDRVAEHLPNRSRPMRLLTPSVSAGRVGDLDGRVPNQCLMYPSSVCWDTLGARAAATRQAGPVRCHEGGPRASPTLAQVTVEVSS
jgi:hypothetical protein